VRKNTRRKTVTDPHALGPNDISAYWLTEFVALQAADWEATCAVLKKTK
jgi:hypothetical protein